MPKTFIHIFLSPFWHLNEMFSFFVMYLVYIVYNIYEEAPFCVSVVYKIIVPHASKFINCEFQVNCFVHVIKSTKKETCKAHSNHCCHWVNQWNVRMHSDWFAIASKMMFMIVFVSTLFWNYLSHAQDIFPNPNAYSL
jgi:hypothetical protein